MEVREMTIEEIKVLLNRKNTEITLLTKNLTSTRGKLSTAVEALKDLVSAQEQLWTSINGRGLLDEAMGNAKQALAEIGGEDE